LSSKLEICKPDIEKLDTFTAQCLVGIPACHKGNVQLKGYNQHLYPSNHCIGELAEKVTKYKYFTTVLGSHFVYFI
jgi:hypothetical protein